MRLFPLQWLGCFLLGSVFPRKMASANNRKSGMGACWRFLQRKVKIMIHHKLEPTWKLGTFPVSEKYLNQLDYDEGGASRKQAFVLSERSRIKGSMPRRLRRESASEKRVPSAIPRGLLRGTFIFLWATDFGAQ